MNWEARVAMQRYRPLTRREGSPMIRPAKAETSPAKGQRQPEGKAQSGDQNGRGIGAHPDKGGVAQRNLSGKAGQQIQPHGPDDGKPDHVGQVEHIGIGHEGEDQEENKKEGQEKLDESGLEDGVVLNIRFFEIAAAHSISRLLVASWLPVAVIETTLKSYPTRFIRKAFRCTNSNSWIRN